ncbi:MAG: hypothetical protein ACLFS3_02595 [Candidatus Aenigmatarchaeota archaeon]
MQERTIAFTGDMGFPTELYFSLIDILEGRGFTVKRVSDWIEVNPQSDYYQEVMQKKQSIQQQVGAVLSRLSEARKDIEMLRHDKRKLDRVLKHQEEGDMETLKSDFIDVVERQTQRGMLTLAQNGIFPSIVVDFYKIEDEEDIDELDISKAEAEVLRRKWKLFQDWLDRYLNGIKERRDMVEEELESRLAALEYLKETLQPYMKAIKRIRAGQPEDYQGFHDPRMVERYSSSISGIKLYAWKEVQLEKKRKFLTDEERRKLYSFLEIEIRKSTIVMSGNQGERIEFRFKPEAMTHVDLQEKKDELERTEEKIMNYIGRMKGEKSDLEEEEEEQETGPFTPVKSKFRKYGRKLLGRTKEGEFINDSEKSRVEEKTQDALDDIYDRLKEEADAMKMYKGRRHVG